MRYRNPHPHTAVLPEHRGDDGRVFPTAAVEPDDVVDWPIPIAGFESAAAERAATPAKKAAAPGAEPAVEAKAKATGERA